MGVPIRLTQPRVYLGLPIVAVVVIAAFFFALRWTTPDRAETPVSQLTVGLAAADSGNPTAENAAPGQHLVECGVEPASRDHFLSQRQRKGLAILGGFVVVTILLLAFGSRFGS